MTAEVGTSSVRAVILPDPPISSYHDLAAELRRQIESGDLAPGAAVPSEKTLQQTYGLARQTIRRAIAELKHEGLVVVVHGRGSVVRSVGDKQTLRIRRGSHGVWRMPTPEERRTLSIGVGVPVLVVTYGRYEDIYPGDRWEFTTS